MYKVEPNSKNKFAIWLQPSRPSCPGGISVKLPVVQIDRHELLPDVEAGNLPPSTEHTDNFVQRGKYAHFQGIHLMNSIQILLWKMEVLYTKDYSLKWHVYRYRSRFKDVSFYSKFSLSMTACDLLYVLVMSESLHHHLAHFFPSGFVSGLYSRMPGFHVTATPPPLLHPPFISFYWRNLDMPIQDEQAFWVIKVFGLWFPC